MTKLDSSPLVNKLKVQKPYLPINTIDKLGATTQVYLIKLISPNWPSRHFENVPTDSRLSLQSKTSSAISNWNQTQLYT